MSWPGRGATAHDWAASLRFDLLDAVGEAIELNMLPRDEAKRLVDKVGKRRGSGLPDCPHFQIRGVMGEEPPYSIVVRGVGLADGQPLLEEDFIHRTVHLHGPPPVPVAPVMKPVGRSFPFFWVKGDDPVNADIRDVPAVLTDVDEAWSDRNSLNFQSATDFTQILSNLIERRKASPHTK
jgi:hypothetical protein